VDTRPNDRKVGQAANYTGLYSAKAEQPMYKKVWIAAGTAGAFA